MNTFGIAEAKASFSNLFSRVANGEVIAIIKRGRLVAYMLSAAEFNRAKTSVAIDALRRESRGRKLRGMSVRKMRRSSR
jgi:prevent-host-death family protein